MLILVHVVVVDGRWSAGDDVDSSLVTQFVQLDACVHDDVTYIHSSLLFLPVFPFRDRFFTGGLRGRQTHTRKEVAALEVTHSTTISCVWKQTWPTAFRNDNNNNPRGLCGGVG